MPTAGGPWVAYETGAEIGCTCIQLFSGSPRQWNNPPIDDATADRFKQARDETGITFAIAHDSYLINLAAPDELVLAKSMRAMLDELERAEALAIPWVVTHMGSYLKSGEEQGLETLCASVNAILEQTDGMVAGIALETTAGQGTNLGYRFEHLAQVIESSGGHPRLGVCMDTCHIFAAGYDIRTPETFTQTIDEFDRVIGLGRLKAIHANDAKKPLGSRVDRHEHLGEGELGLETFRMLIQEARLAAVPTIIETPEAETRHQGNLAILQGLRG